jgi:hypothetical protein
MHSEGFIFRFPGSGLIRVLGMWRAVNEYSEQSKRASSGVKMAAKEFAFAYNYVQSTLGSVGVMFRFGESPSQPVPPNIGLLIEKRPWESAITDCREKIAVENLRGEAEPEFQLLGIHLFVRCPSLVLVRLLLQVKTW